MIPYEGVADLMLYEDKWKSINKPVNMSFVSWMRSDIVDHNLDHLGCGQTWGLAPTCFKPPIDFDESFIIHRNVYIDISIWD